MTTSTGRPTMASNTPVIPQVSSTTLPHWSNRRLYEKARRLRHLEGKPLLVDATGTHRRIRALMAIGWRARDIAPYIGWRSGELDTIFRRCTVHQRTAASVAAAYAVLSDTPGPSEQTRRRAIRAGHLPPIWWDDDTIDDPTADAGRQDALTPSIDPVVVDRYLAGHTTVRPNRAEKRLAYDQLRAAGHTVTAVSTRLRLSGATARLYEASRLRDNVDGTAPDLHDLQAEEATP